jgi:hypothetical protein
MDYGEFYDQLERELGFDPGIAYADVKYHEYRHKLKRKENCSWEEWEKRKNDQRIS